jgi:hypothetical protein
MARGVRVVRMARRVAAASTQERPLRRKTTSNEGARAALRGRECTQAPQATQIHGRLRASVRDDRNVPPRSESLALEAGAAGRTPRAPQQRSKLIHYRFVIIIFFFNRASQ